MPGLLLLTALLGLLVTTVNGGALQGALNDPDSYMQIVLLRDLIGSGGWHVGPFLRDNAPYGFTMHWSAAYELLVLALAAPLAAVMGWSAAVTALGPFLGPVWAALLIVVGVWAAAPVCTPCERAAVGIALACTPAALVWGAFGNADHHLPVLIAWVAQMGFALRVARGEGGRLAGAGAGLAAAAALWLNADCILPVSLGFGAMALAWIRVGGRLSGGNLAAAAAFAVSLVALLAFDPPSRGLLAGHLDRLSVVYVTFALLVAALWCVIARAPRAPAAWPARLGVGVGGAAVAATLLVVVFPQILTPEQSVFGALEAPTLWDAVAEMLPAFHTAGNGVLFLGGPIVGIVTAAAFAWQSRGTPAFAGWGLFLGLLLFAGALGFARTRFAIYPEALGALPVGMLLARIGPEIARRFPRASPRLWGVVLGGLIVTAPVVAAAMLQPPSGAVPAATTRNCAIPQVAGALDDATFMGGRALIVLTHPNDAPALLYWTGHRTVAGPYHRNVEGIEDVRRFLTDRGDGTARRIARYRGISYVLICQGRDLAWPPRGDGTLLARLEAGQAPGWLRPYPWPAGTATDLRLFRVVSP